MTERASGSPQSLQLPERRMFWRWVWSAVRPVLGWVLAGLGALALFLGWWGVSGQSLTAKQLPYVVSGGLTGVALVILAGVFLATDDVRQQLSRLDRLERKVDDLYALFVDADSAAVDAAATQPVALASGSSFHRPDCALVRGKEAQEVDAATVASRGLQPCRVCDPAAPPARD